MALKDDVLNSYFSSPLSRRKRIAEGSELDGSTVPKKSRFFHDRESESAPPVSEESKEKTSKIFEDLKTIFNDKSLVDVDDTSSISNKSDNVFLDIPLKKHIKVAEKRNAEVIKEVKHNTSVFFPTDPSALQKLSMLIKKTRGLQKDVLCYIVDRCRGSGSFDSGPIDLMDISNKYDSSTDFVRTAIKRLLAKSLIMKGKGKTGPTGYSVFYVPSEVKEIILNIQK
jgi:hypothetical protein